ncbi:MAG: hypothetical protein DIZ80_17145 [endosymbiont of Galathealinum brachiosum]|uniref:Uncharacterized protein n=1 Tax=endosymbiont of Galathealinum brachiosum TaxID=2200906 RepID=A0A370D6W3_9GAMM|nr:MAG: hypothetical protein DIZ80_17145 [endosymbiont of Galathealinum brachiosum]
MNSIVKTNYCFIALTGLSLFSQNALSECNRDDVEFYLSKNFTTQQITELCKASSEEKSVPVIVSSKTQINLSDDEAFIKQAIDARNIIISKEYLEYTLRVCVEYAEEDNYGFSPKVCPDIRYKIALNDLEAEETDKKLFFFGENGIDVEGDISREVLSGLEKRSDEEKKYLFKRLESGDETNIPVREGVSSKKAAQVLNKLLK